MRVNFEEIVLAKQTTEPIAMIAIDGPAASGKSTVGRLLAEQLHYLYLDTGCMYRAVTWAALQQEIELLKSGKTTPFNAAKKLLKSYNEQT